MTKWTGAAWLYRQPARRPRIDETASVGRSVHICGRGLCCSCARVCVLRHCVACARAAGQCTLSLAAVWERQVHYDD
jgi:hypothetical protein